MSDPDRSHSGAVPAHGDHAIDILRWSLADTRVIRRQDDRIGGFTTDIAFDGRTVLIAASAGRGHEVAYTRAEDRSPWEAWLQEAARQWLTRLGIGASGLDHHREVWLDWKVYGEPAGIGEGQLVMSLAEALTAASFPAIPEDWADILGCVDSREPGDDSTGKR